MIEITPPRSEQSLSPARANWMLLVAVAGFLLMARALAHFTGLNPYYAEIVFFLIVPILVIRREGSSPAAMLRMDRFRGESVLLGMGIYILSLLVTIGLTFVTMGVITRFGFSSWDSAPTAMFQSDVPLMQQLFFFALVPAVCEEAFFRGYLLRAYAPLGTWWAIGINSLLFALLHGSILRLPVTFAMGVTFSLLVLKTGSLFASMVVHLINNAVAVVIANGLSRLVPQSQSPTIGGGLPLPAIPAWGLAIGAAIGLIGAVAIWAIVRPERPFAASELRPLPVLRRTLLTVPVLIVMVFYLVLNFSGLS